MACRFVRAWVVLVIVHFIVQTALQGVTLRDNNQAKNITSYCLSLAQVPIGLPLLEDDGLSICDGIPGHSNVTCVLVVSSERLLLSLPLTNVDVTSLTDFDLDDIYNIILSGSEQSITGRCAISLRWIHDV